MGWTLLISMAGNEACSFLLQDRCCVKAKISSLLLFLSWLPSALVSPTPCASQTILCFCHPKLFSAGGEMLWPSLSGCFNLPSWLTPSHSHCSPLSPISLTPSAAKSWLCWSQWQKSHSPRKPQFHWNCYQNKYPGGWCPSDGQSAFMLKCLFVHSPLASYDSIIKALSHFFVYYCVRFSGIITVSWLL